MPEPSPSGEPLQLVDLSRKRFPHRRLAGEFGQGGDAADLLRVGVNGYAQGAADGFEDQRPVAAGTWFYVSDDATALVGDGVNGAQGVAICLEQEWAGAALVAWLDLNSLGVLNEHVGIGVVLAQGRHQPCELIHQSVDRSHLPPRNADSQANAAGPSTRAAVRVTAIGKPREDRVDFDTSAPGARRGLSFGWHANERNGSGRQRVAAGSTQAQAGRLGLRYSAVGRALTAPLP